MTARRVFNPTAGPLVVDDEGHTLAGGEAADLETDGRTEAGARVRELVDAGLLIVAEAPEPSPSSSSSSSSSRKSKE